MSRHGAPQAGHVARKRFGQHFLTDSAIIGAIVREIDPRPGQALVEIGPGLMALTQPLLERYRRFFDAARPPGDHPDPFFTFLRLSDLKHGHVRVHGSRVAGSFAAGVLTHDLGVRRITRVAFAS